jgi:anti-anti-sigma regulatory factor
VEMLVTRDDRTVVVEIRGRIAGEEVDRVVELLEMLPEKGHERVTVRFGEVSYLQPPVLNALFALLRRLPDNGSLELVAQAPNLARLLQAVGLTGRRKVVMLEEREEALAA